MTLLEIAETYWSEGEPLPLDIAMRLMAEGYDVEALEAEHTN
ncbi:MULTISPECIES: hypothetical protein [unclassified Thioalkalivibrio]|nr:MULTISPECIES: hypothetical protein [unclassified Thioalkalivibrio]